MLSIIAVGIELASKQAVKQSKTTLIFGVLLAIIVTILVVMQINNTTPSFQPTKSESASAMPIVQKSLSLLNMLRAI